MKLVERDFDFFAVLYELKHLTAELLAMHFSMSLRRMNRRLKKLYDDGFLNRAQRFSQNEFGRCEYVYSLTKKAIVEWAAYFEPRSSSETEYTKCSGTYPMEHLLIVNQFLLTLSACCKASDQYSTKYIPEHRRIIRHGKVISYIRDSVSAPDGTIYEFIGKETIMDSEKATQIIRDRVICGADWTNPYLLDEVKEGHPDIPEDVFDEAYLEEMKKKVESLSGEELAKLCEEQTSESSANQNFLLQELIEGRIGRN